MLLIITVTTNGKWWLSFEDAAPHQMQTKTSCAATIMLRQREEEDDHQVAVDLGPRGEERDLVAQAEGDEERRAATPTATGSRRAGERAGVRSIAVGDSR